MSKQCIEEKKQEQEQEKIYNYFLRQNSQYMFQLGSKNLQLVVNVHTYTTTQSVHSFIQQQ